MQPRFERRMGKTIYRMIEQPRFRAACDFLQLRAPPASSTACWRNGGWTWPMPTTTCAAK